MMLIARNEGSGVWKIICFLLHVWGSHQPQAPIEPFAFKQPSMGNKNVLCLLMPKSLAAIIMEWEEKMAAARRRRQKAAKQQKIDNNNDEEMKENGQNADLLVNCLIGGCGNGGGKTAVAVPERVRETRCLWIGTIAAKLLSIKNKNGGTDKATSSLS